MRIIPLTRAGLVRRDCHQPPPRARRPVGDEAAGEEPMEVPCENPSSSTTP
jgi:hypothetical protein